MSNLYANYGFDFMLSDDKKFRQVASVICKEGRTIRGYYGLPYIYKSFGHMEFWAALENEDENKKRYCLDALHIHCCGNTIWNIVPGIDITPSTFSKTEKVILTNKINGRDTLLPIEIINADIIPSFLEDDVIKVQVVAQPLGIEYFKDYDSYQREHGEEINGKQWCIDEGSLLPLAFLANHNADNNISNDALLDDAYISFVAKVEALYYGEFDMIDEKQYVFIRCVADTIYGKIEFHHSFDQIDESQWENIKVGSIISGVCVISADAAIDEHHDGIIKDLEHNLKLMKYTIIRGDVERLHSILDKDAVYESDNVEETFVGADKIIERIKYVNENTSHTYYTYMSELVKSDDEEYPEGTKCVVLAMDDVKGYESILFLKLNDDGMVVKIKISKNKNFIFKINEKEEMLCGI